MKELMLSESQVSEEKTAIRCEVRIAESLCSDIENSSYEKRKREFICLKENDLTVVYISFCID